jgi:hypothetical protein
MGRYACLRLVVLISTTAICLSLARPSIARGESSSQRFTAAGREVLHSLTTGNWAALAHMTSATGLLIVKRELNWDATLSPQKRHGGATGKTSPKTTWVYDLNLDRLRPVVWSEQQVWFLPSEFNTPEFRAAARQFQGLVRNSEDRYRGLVNSLTKYVRARLQDRDTIQRYADGRRAPRCHFV